MKVKIFNPLHCLAIASLITVASCEKKEALAVKDNEPQVQMQKQTLGGNQTLAIGDTLLNVTYESGTLNSGISNLTTTHATATDASYINSTGHSGTYSIAHKVTLDNAGYFSDGAPRSESAANLVTDAIIRVGQERRYEFSVLLKDWDSWQAGESQTGDIIFQGKHAGGNSPSWYVMTKRNAIAFRAPVLGLQADILGDYRNYINQWIDIRVDVKWTDDNTGYYKSYLRLPGETNYTLKNQYLNQKTFHPENPTTQGYIKWGLYRPSESLAQGDVETRIIYHDDIRIIALN